MCPFSSFWSGWFFRFNAVKSTITLTKLKDVSDSKATSLTYAMTQMDILVISYVFEFGFCQPAFSQDEKGTFEGVAGLEE